MKTTDHRQGPLHPVSRLPAPPTSSADQPDKRMKHPVTGRWTSRARAASVAALIALFAAAPVATADIYQWEYIDPADPGRGKRQSTTLAPDGAGVNAARGANLSNRNLTMGYLIGADLTADVVRDSGGNIIETTRANLTGTNLTQADLSGANLGVEYHYDPWYDAWVGVPAADLSGANLREANLANASLIGATLTGANFTGARVRGASLSGSGITLSQLYSTGSYQSRDLTGISFIGNNLAGADLSGQNLTNARFDSDGAATNLAGANLNQSDLTNASFSGTLLTDADLGGAKLTNASFQGATLTGANFSGADVRSAVFSPYSGGTGITTVQLYSTGSYKARDLTGIALPC